MRRTRRPTDMPMGTRIIIRQDEGAVMVGLVEFSSRGGVGEELSLELVAMWRARLLPAGPR